MAAQGGIRLQEKVNRLVSKERGKPVLRPNRPLVLRDYVTNRKPKKGEASCITEMSVMMACWKQNNFLDALCSNEVKAFFTCVETAQAAQRNKSEQTGDERGRLSHQQASTLLKRFPNPRSEI